MNKLLNINVLTMSSEEIAELVDSRHDKVKQSINRLIERGVISEPLVGDGIKSANGTVPIVYLLEKRDSIIVVAQLSPEFTAKLVDRWQELEGKQKPKTQLELAKEQVVLLERLEAIEIERANLKVTLDMAHDWSSIKRMEMRDGKKYFYPPLRNYSKANGYEVKKVFDQNYGEVNSYHKDVWEAIYGVIIY
jgi:phage regulator Rha-like protein